MPNETILISEVIPTTPQRIFSAWLDSAEHSSFTGSQAAVLPFVGGEYSAWDGYVQGRTLELNDGARIVQSWRTNEFPADSPDSRLEITLEATLGGTLLTLLHTDIPSGQSDRVREGWNEYYLSRMKSYFAEAVAAADESDFAAAVDALGSNESDAEIGDFVMGDFGAPSAPAAKPVAAKRAAPQKAKAATKAAGRKPATKVKAAAKKKKPTKPAAKRTAKATKKKPKVAAKSAAKRSVGKRSKAPKKSRKSTARKPSPRKPSRRKRR